MSNETKILSAIGIVTLIIVIVGVIFLSNSSTPSQTPTQTQVTQADMSKLNANSAHKIVVPDAKVTITEFADYQCPACANYYPELEKIKTEYQGKINVTFKHFPLPMHPFAKNAARAAEAAGEQGKFWEMTEKLFKNQDEWSKNPSETFIKYANELGLDQKMFTDSMNSTKFDAIIDQDESDAEALGVNSTPTVYINDKKMTVAPTAGNLKKEIDTILNSQ